MKETPSYYALPGLKRYKSEPDLTSANVNIILERVCKQYDVNMKQLISHSRKAELVFPRHLAMYLLRKHTHLCLESIGNIFNRDHTSIIHAVKTIKAYLDTDCFGRRQEIIAIY